MRIQNRILDSHWKKNRSGYFCFQFLVNILVPWTGSEFVDPYIFADADPGSQNVAEPSDLDPKQALLEKLKV